MHGGLELVDHLNQHLNYDEGSLERTGFPVSSYLAGYFVRFKHRLLLVSPAQDGVYKLLIYDDLFTLKIDLYHRLISLLTYKRLCRLALLLSSVLLIISIFRLLSLQKLDFRDHSLRRIRFNNLCRFSPLVFHHRLIQLVSLFVFSAIFSKSVKKE